MTAMSVAPATFGTLVASDAVILGFGALPGAGATHPCVGSSPSCPARSSTAVVSDGAQMVRAAPSSFAGHCAGTWRCAWRGSVHAAGFRPEHARRRARKLGLFTPFDEACPTMACAQCRPLQGSATLSRDATLLQCAYCNTGVYGFGDPETLPRPRQSPDMCGNPIHGTRIGHFANRHQSLGPRLALRSPPDDSPSDDKDCRRPRRRSRTGYNPKPPPTTAVRCMAPGVRGMWRRSIGGPPRCRSAVRRSCSNPWPVVLLL